jgi:hypothetical protein
MRPSVAKEPPCDYRRPRFDWSRASSINEQRARRSEGFKFKPQNFDREVHLETRAPHVFEGHELVSFNQVEEVG